MELYQLRAFSAIADTGQLTRAADRLHVSQPALSAQIKALEAELGQVLFERKSNGMRLTRMGQELLPLAHQVIAAAHALKRAAQAHRSDVAGRVRIGTVSDPQFIRLGEFLGRALERYPLIEIDVRNESTGAAFEEVRAGDLDASFFFGEIDDPAITGTRLGEMAYRIAAPAEWAEQLRNSSWEHAAEMPWIIAPENSTHHRLAHAVLDKHGVAPTKVVGADNEGVILNLIESGVGLSLVREDLAFEREREGAIFVWPQARLLTALWFIHRTDRSNDPLLRALLDVLAQTWSNEPGAPSDTPASGRRIRRRAHVHAATGAPSRPRVDEAPKFGVLKQGPAERS